MAVYQRRRGPCQPLRQGNAEHDDGKAGGEDVSRVKAGGRFIKSVDIRNAAHVCAEVKNDFPEPLFHALPFLSCCGDSTARKSGARALSAVLPVTPAFVKCTGIRRPVS